VVQEDLLKMETGKLEKLAQFGRCNLMGQFPAIVPTNGK
jgi:hypothetical protein